MRENPNLDEKCDFFSARRIEEVIILRFK